MKKLFTLLSSVLLFATIALAQPGALDHSFNAGFIFAPEAQSIANVTKIVALPDGKAIVAGVFFFGGLKKALIRINADGTADNSFINSLLTYVEVTDMVVQADGKILVITNSGDGGVFTLIRLNADGSLDAGFNVTLATTYMTKVNVQSDGKVLLIAYATFATGSKLYRLNTDGSQDMSFGTGGVVQPVDEYNIAVQADDKIIVSTENGSSAGLLIRLNANGTPDAGFDFSVNLYNGTSIGNIKKIIAQANGKILIAGNFVFGDINTPSSLHYSGLARLNTDGSIDNSFIDGAILTTYVPGEFEFNDIATAYQQPDGKIYVSGYTFYQSQGITKSHLIRLNNDGSRDVSFAGGDGIVLQGTNTQEIGISTINAIAQLPNGKILAGGFFGYSHNYNGATVNNLARLYDNGSLDNGTGFNSTPQTVLLQTDGKIIVGGLFSSYNGVANHRLVRVNTDGSLDVGFNTDADFSLGISDNIYSTAIQADGKILVGSYYYQYPPNGQRAFTRLNTDGSTDASFNIPAEIQSSYLLDVKAITVQPDDKILVWLNIRINEQDVVRLYRLNTDGSADASFSGGYISDFSTAVGYGGLLHSIAVQPDGKIIIAGVFSSVLGVPRKSIARLNEDGTLDMGFDADITAANLEIYNILLQPDGKIITVGTNGIKRYNADGSTDAGFIIPPGTGTNNQIVGAVVLQPNGKIIVSNDGGIDRLNTDGTIDESFYPPVTGIESNYIYAMAIQPDGKIIIAGDFGAYDGYLVGRIARILTGPSCTSTVAPTINISASPTGTICASTPVTFTATNTNGGTNPGYQWQLNGTNIIAANSATYSSSVLSNGDVIRCVLNAHAPCLSPTSDTSNSITVSVTERATPFVSIAITTGTLPVCIGSPLAFTAAPVNGGTAPSYQWKITRSGNTFNAGTNAPTFTYSSFSDNDIISCVLTSNATCVSPATAASNSVQIHVNTFPSNWYLDADGDGYAVSTMQACINPGAGYTSTVLPVGDCDDNNAAVHQEYLFYIDADHDGYGTFTNGYACAPDANTPPPGYSLIYGDCDDNDVTAWQIGLVYFDVDGDGYYGSSQFICYGNTLPPGSSLTTLGPDCDDNDINAWHTIQFYVDNDGDGYTENGNFAFVCVGATFTYPPGYNSITTLGPDCDDNNNILWQGGLFYIDNDEDGTYGSLQSNCFGDVLPPHYYRYDGTWLQDCDDNNNTILGGILYYADNDGDGFGNTNNSQYICGADHNGYVLDNFDCDDNNASIHPGAIDICNNGIDEDCSGTADDQPTTYYADGDGDGFGDASNSIQTCDATHAGYVTNNTDCDDANTAVNPGAEEIYGNGIDDNCDGLIDTRKLFRNKDFDSYGDPAVFRTDYFYDGYYFDVNDGLAYSYVLDNTDCDDNNYNVHPGVQEICDGIDNDCNGIIDDNVAPTYAFIDRDADGYTDFSLYQVVNCNAGVYTLPQGYVLNTFGAIDCDDNNAAVNPGATEFIGNGIDDDCNPLTVDNPNNCEPTMSTSSQTVCDSYLWNSTTYTVSGTYTYLTTNAAGCDSTATLILTVNTSTAHTTTATACDSYTWSGPLGNGQTYTTSGTHTFTSTNAAGCPHVETLNLTINASTAHTTTATACDSYTWSGPLGNGQTYTTSGTQTFTSTNAAGCPHVETLNLTVNASPTVTITSSPVTTTNLPTGTTVTLTASAGSSYLWSNNATTQIITVTTAGSYSVRVTNTGGCSSTSAKLVSYGSCTSKPSTPGAISGAADVCTSMSGTTYSISAVSKATLYKWAVPAGCTIISPTSVISGINNDTVVTSSTSITVGFPAGFVSGNIKVAAINDCGQSGFRSSSTIKKIVAATPGAITADKEILDAICAGQDVTFNTAPVTNASGYLWKVPVGCTITNAGTGGTILSFATGDSAVTVSNASTLIKVRFPATYTTGSVKVQAYRQCLTIEKSGTRSLTVTKVLPSQPAAITGITNTCSSILNNTSSIYTVTPNTKGVVATGYEWTVTGTTPGSVFITETGGVAITPVTSVITTSSVLSIGVKFQNNFTGGTVSVKAVRFCQTGTAARSLNLTKNPITPALSGPTAPCISTIAGVNEYTYALSSGLTGITGFTWTKPGNAVLVSGSLTGNSSSLKLRFTSIAAGKVTVKTISACGTSATATVNTAPVNCTALAKLSASSVPVAAITDEIKATVYPNPNSGNYHLRFETSNKVDNADVQIINALGQIVGELKGININGTIELNVNNSKLVPGLYHIRYQVGHQAGALKMIIQR